MIHVTPFARELIEDINFYTLYDDLYFFNKANLMNYISYTDFYSIVHQELKDEEEIKKWRDNLRVDVHFTCIHNIEVMIELLVAIYKNIPAAIYLNTYDKTLKKAENIIRKDFFGLTGNKRITSDQFVIETILSGFTHDSKEFTESIDYTFKVLSFLCDHYITYLDSYNSFKHGLRISQGERRFEIALAEDDPKFEALINSDTLSYLLKPEIKSGNTYYDMEICNYDSNLSMHLVTLMHKIVNTVRTSRLANLKKLPLNDVKLINKQDWDVLEEKYINARLSVVRFNASRE